MLFFSSSLSPLYDNTEAKLSRIVVDLSRPEVPAEVNHNRAQSVVVRKLDRAFIRLADTEDHCQTRIAANNGFHVSGRQSENNHDCPYFLSHSFCVEIETERVDGKKYCGGRGEEEEKS